MPRRFRVYAGRANPAAVRLARLGELLQLARIWQVHEDGTLSALAVQQEVFWNVSCMAVEPTAQTVSGFSIPPVGLPLVDAMAQGVNAGAAAIADAVNGFLSGIAAETASTEFWTT